jgi:predicted TIM-barrel fold metal-dependent hydrolase
MRTIAVEEHCLTAALRELLGRELDLPAQLEARLLDVGEGRIAEMDSHGIDLQVLSSAQPGLERTEPHTAVPAARSFNDRVAEAIAGNPERLAAFAALPSSDPASAAHELVRTVR